MINYDIVNTGSDGNCVVLENSVAIDMGVSFKKIKKYCNQLNVVFLTHIHSDHFNKSTIKKLAQNRPTLRFGCCDWLVENLIKCGVSKKNIDVLEMGKRYNYGHFKISPIKAYHDVPNCGYRIYFNNVKALYITDTAHLEGITAKDYDLYLIEANYEEEQLKQRIENKALNSEFIYESRVDKTHLSKEQCNSFLIENANDNSMFEYLHIHKESV